jgi:hypothetical protein
VEVRRQIERIGKPIESINRAVPRESRMFADGQFVLAS